MIRLENIKKEGNLISCKVITVELHPIAFEIVVDLKEERLIKNTLGHMDSNVGMAMWKLIKLYKEFGDDIPEVSESAWY